MTKRRELLTLAERVPGAWIGMKIAALLLIVEGQRPGWIAEVLGLTRMSLCRWIHSVNEQGVQSLVPQPKPGRPARLTGKVRRELSVGILNSPLVGIEFSPPPDDEEIADGWEAAVGRRCRPEGR
ncbi:MAG: helix-turn-helix domain-containing protein [Burkholderiales bacterium]